MTVSIAPQAWLVEQIGGERVVVTTLVEPGTSPSTYQPSDAQVSRMMRSAVYFRVGVPCERGPWFEAIQSSRRVEIVDLREGIDRLLLPRHHHDVEAERGNRHTNGNDPHIWLSPARLKVQAKTIGVALERLDPDHSAEYRHQRERFEASLGRLDRDLRQQLAPHAGRAFLVFHPAWGYFADDYELRQLALEIEGKSPSEAEVTQLQKLARSEGLGVIFVQPQIRGSAAAAVAEAIGGRTEVLDPLAADVVANLRHVAGRIVRLFETP